MTVLNPAGKRNTTSELSVWSTSPSRLLLSCLWRMTERELVCRTVGCSPGTLLSKMAVCTLSRAWREARVMLRVW